MDRLLVSHARRLTRDLAAWSGPAHIDFQGNSHEARRLRSVLELCPRRGAHRQVLLDLIQSALRVATNGSVAMLRTASESIV